MSKESQKKSMGIIFGKIARFFIGVVGIAIEVFNLFSGDIIIYEVTEGIKFDWNALLTNATFWIVIVVEIVYYVSLLFVTQKVKVKDKALEKAYSKASVKIVGEFTKSVTKKDFESCEKTLEMLDELQKRRENNEY